MNIKLGISNRHVHLTKETYDKLFDEELTKLRDLDQPGQFAANQTLDIKCGRKRIKDVRIVGPFREYNQIEVSKTDSYTLKVDPPIRDSGDVKDSLPVLLITKKAKVQLDEGLIIADRHIHLTPQDVQKYGLDGVREVAIKINGEKSGIIKNVYLKVAENSSLRLHLDTDDANAFGLKNDAELEVLRIKE